MPRRQSHVRKIGNNSEDSIRKGLTLIRNGMSIRQASKTIGVPFSTLKRYYSNTKNAASLEGQRLQPNYAVNKIFSTEQECLLKNYVKHCALLFYGLTTKECRRIAYQCAKINNLKMPPSWKVKEMAGKDWLVSFKSRHELSIRRPEPCSLSRATAFNQNNVAIFFENLENLIKRNPAFANGTRIFNLDETSTTTVQKPQKVVAPKGRKCIGKVTSGERGTLVTTCCIIGASGIVLPPVMVFPRKHFKEHMIKNTPSGTLGLATPTGWMNSTIFPEVIKHFIKHSYASKENPCILIMDNHESHLCLEALDLAKNAGVHILTLHPHTSAKLQPLDVGIYGPFKIFYNAAIDSWLMRHPGKPITIYDLGEVIGIAFQKAMTPVNISKAFKKCGIYPFDKFIFTEEDFLPSSVTDRPCPDAPHTSSSEKKPATLQNLATQALMQLSPNAPIDVQKQITNAISFKIPKPTFHQKCQTPEPTKPEATTSVSQASMNLKVILTPLSNSTLSSSSFISPFSFRDPIKAGPRKTDRKKRKAGRSLIPTDTPEKLLIEQEKNAVKRKKKCSKEKDNSKGFTK